MWQKTNNSLSKTYNLHTFSDALRFVGQVGSIAERLLAQPKILVNEGAVELNVSSTTQGERFAEAVDSLVGEEIVSKETQNLVQLPYEVKLYGDGGSRGNPGPSAGGFVVLDMEDHVLHENGKYLGITTNNQAEYHSLKGGLEAVLHGGARVVHVFMDSMLVVNQMKGIFKIRNRDLWPIHQAAADLVSKFEKVTFTHVPRELNRLADTVVNDTLDKQG